MKIVLRAMNIHSGKLAAMILLTVNAIVIYNYAQKDYDLRRVRDVPQACMDISKGFNASISPVRRNSSLQFDYSRPGKTLWYGDPQCSKHLVFFGNDMKFVQLLSYPRSGNTWTRYLLEASTGMYTGSVYRADFPVSKGYYGEKEDIYSGTTLVVKTHAALDTKSAILLIRNPERSCVSFWNYKRTDDVMEKHTNSVAKDTYDTKKFHDHVQRSIKNWKNTVLNGLKVDNVLPIYYEYLRTDTLKYVRKMLEFLHVTPEEDRLECVMKFSEGPVKGGQRTVDPFTQEERKLFADAVAEVEGRLYERGFPPLPDYNNYID